MVDRVRLSVWGLVQGALDATYAKHGPRGLFVVAVGGSTAFVSVIAILIDIVTAEFLGVAWQDVTRFAVFQEIGLLACTAAGIAATWREVGALLTWKGEGRSAERAPVVWRACLVGSRLVILRIALLLYAFVIIGGIPLLIFEFDQPVWVFAPGAVAWVFLICAGGIFAVQYLEVVYRPLMRDCASFLPLDFEPDVPPLSLKAKVVLPFPGAVAFTVMIALAFADSSASFGSRIVVGVALALVTAGTALVLFLLAAHAALDPIDHLTAATERVRADDLTATVPVLGADELGRLATSFNLMLEGLRDRETLREHNSQLLADVQASRARIVAAADNERKRMERDIHDGAQQRLVLINLKLGMLEGMMARDPAGARDLLAELRADATRAVDELRDLAHGIYPPLLESDGLAAALSDVGDQSRFPVAVADNHTGRYPAEVEAAVYFCCLEALQNCAKHAGDGSRASIELSENDGFLHFAVRDDGPGFDRARVNGSAGLQNMTDRIGALGGRLLVLSAPGAGTSVEGEVPV